MTLCRLPRATEEPTQPTRWPTSGPRASVSHTAAGRGGGRQRRLSPSLPPLAGGESAVKLLTKFGLLEAAVDYATDNL